MAACSPDPQTGWLQICKAGLTHTRKIWLTRHGESEYNTRDLLGGNSNLSPKGQAYAKQLPDIIVDRIPLVSSFDLLQLCFGGTASW